MAEVVGLRMAGSISRVLNANLDQATFSWIALIYFGGLEEEADLSNRSKVQCANASAFRSRLQQTQNSGETFQPTRIQ